MCPHGPIVLNIQTNKKYVHVKKICIAVFNLIHMKWNKGILPTFLMGWKRKNKQTNKQYEKLN